MISTWKPCVFIETGIYYIGRNMSGAIFPTKNTSNGLGLSGCADNGAESADNGAETGDNRSDSADNGAETGDNGEETGDNGAETGDKSRQRLQQILALMENSVDYRAEEIAHALGLSLTRTKVLLRALCAQNALVKLGANRNRRYRKNSNG